VVIPCRQKQKTWCMDMLNDVAVCFTVSRHWVTGASVEYY